MAAFFFPTPDNLLRTAGDTGISATSHPWRRPMAASLSIAHPGQMTIWASSHLSLHRYPLASSQQQQQLRPMLLRCVLTVIIHIHIKGEMFCATFSPVFTYVLVPVQVIAHLLIFAITRFFASAYSVITHLHLPRSYCHHDHKDFRQKHLLMLH